MPSSPLFHYLPGFAQIHVQWVGDATQPSHPLPPTSHFAFNLSKHQGLFPGSHHFASSGQSIRASVSASVFLMNIQSWFPWGLTGLNFLQSKRLSLLLCSAKSLQSCPTLFEPMNHTMPDLPIHHQLPEFTQTHVHRVLSSVDPFSSCPQSLPASGSSRMSQLFAWGGQSIGVSALASVLPKNTQDWSPLGRTGWTSLQSKGISRVFSNTTVQKHQFFSSTQLSSQSNSYIHTWPL